MGGRKQRERHGRTGNSRNAHLCKGGSSENDTRATLATPTYAREEAARTTRGQLSQRPPMQGRKQRERHGRTGNSRNAHLCKGGSSENDTDGRTGNSRSAHLCKGGSSENDTDGRAPMATPTYARDPC